MVSVSVCMWEGMGWRVVLQLYFLKDFPTHFISNSYHPWNLNSLKCLFYLTIECKSSYHNSFIIYCNDIANFLFWVLCTCLATSTKNDNTNLQKLLMFMCMHKSKLLFWDIVKILQTCYFDYFENVWACPSIWHHLVGNFDVQSVEMNLQETLFICMQKLTLPLISLLR